LLIPFDFSARSWPDSYVSYVNDAPIELLAPYRPSQGLIPARREGEPSFVGVQDIGDAMMAAMARGVDLVVPADLAGELLGDLPRDLPDWIKIR
jgi:hypothetical protein